MNIKEFQETVKVEDTLLLTGNYHGPYSFMGYAHCPNYKIFDPICSKCFGRAMLRNFKTTTIENKCIINMNGDLMGNIVKDFHLFDESEFKI